MTNHYRTLARDENQARGIGQYAIDFLSGTFADPDDAVFAKVDQFHVDSVACAIAALAENMNAPRVLREEALLYPVDPATGATCFGSMVSVAPEKAVLANCAAVRELDANGTNFGYNPRTGQQRGEFGHNDFYPVAMAAAQIAKSDGRQLLRAMICLDEIRGRLAEAFALKDHKIDHVVHGAIASAAVYGAMLGATAKQIESAIGLTVAHYIPFRAIRAGHQLSDSKGASAAISAEVAVNSMRRAMRGFIGPADIFRNPQAIFCLFEPPSVAGDERSKPPASSDLGAHSVRPQPPECSPFDLHLATSGNDFAVMDMHFKLGLYEHQSAGAIQGLLDVLSTHPQVMEDAEQLDSLRITIYEPAFSIIGDPAKRDPRTRQSADHSMVYIIATLLRKALESKQSGWRELMLMPADYADDALFHPLTRELMNKIDFEHGGPEYDAKYPDGIPTSLELTHAQLGQLSSGVVMYPLGHARNKSTQLDSILLYKWEKLVGLSRYAPERILGQLRGLTDKSPDEVARCYQFKLA